MACGFPKLMRWIWFLLLVAGMILSVVSGASCRFMNYLLTDGSGSASAAGLYRFTDPADGGTCHHYREQRTYDGSEEAARAGAVIAPMCAAAAFVLVLFESLVCRVPYMKVLVGLILLTAIICQGLTFLLLASTELCNVNTIGDLYNEIHNQKPCTVSSGGVASSFALLCYFLASVVLCCAPKPDPLCCRKDRIEKEGSGGSSTDNVAASTFTNENDGFHPDSENGII